MIDNHKRRQLDVGAMDKTAWEQTCEFYSGLPDRSLWGDIETCSREGGVIITPDYVLMGRRVGHGWLVHFALGRDCMPNFVRHMPYYLPFIGWERGLRKNSRVHWYPTEQVLKKLGVKL